jgi:hypothetical protein
MTIIEHRVLTDDAGDYRYVKIKPRVIKELTFFEALQYARRGYFIQRPHHITPCYLDHEHVLRSVQGGVGKPGIEYEFAAKDIMDSAGNQCRDWVALDQVISYTCLSFFQAFECIPFLSDSIVYIRRAEWESLGIKTKVFSSGGFPVDAKGNTLTIRKSDMFEHDWYVCMEIKGRVDDRPAEVKLKCKKTIKKTIKKSRKN